MICEASLGGFLSSFDREFYVELRWWFFLRLPSGVPFATFFWVPHEALFRGYIWEFSLVVPCGVCLTCFTKCDHVVTYFLCIATPCPFGVSL